MCKKWSPGGGGADPLENDCPIWEIPFLSLASLHRFAWQWLCLPASPRALQVSTTHIMPSQQPPHAKLPEILPQGLTDPPDHPHNPQQHFPHHLPGVDSNHQAGFSLPLLWAFPGYAALCPTCFLQPWKSLWDPPYHHQLPNTDALIPIPRRR